MMYEQTLVKKLNDYIKPSVIKKNNRHKRWDYGYNADHDIVIISKDGTLGEVIQIQNLVIGLPSEPEKVYKRSNKKAEQKWEKPASPPMSSLFPLNSLSVATEKNSKEMSGLAIPITNVARASISPSSRLILSICEPGDTISGSLKCSFNQLEMVCSPLMF